LLNLFKWHYYLQQDLEETQVTCMIDLEQTMRDWSTYKHKQMQVSYAENHLSRTIDIHWKIEDESSKNTSYHEIIYIQ